MHKILYFLQRTGDFSSGSCYVNFTQSGAPSLSLWNSIFIFTFAGLISGTPSEMGLKKAIDFRYLWRVDIGKSCLFYRQWSVFCYCILLNWYNYYSSSSTSVITPNSSNANPLSISLMEWMSRLSISSVSFENTRLIVFKCSSVLSS